MSQSNYFSTFKHIKGKKDFETIPQLMNLTGNARLPINTQSDFGE